jgi:hypothetical protein
MKSRTLLLALGLSLLGLLSAAALARAEELEPKYQEIVNRGLKWLAKEQHRDGHWEGSGGAYPVSMTALSAMAFLMEGSTMSEGKYSQNIMRACDWLMARTQPNGLIGNVQNQQETYRYMYGHGYALLFLACVYGEEEDADRRRKLEDLLTRAVKFTVDAQSSTGGWNYTSARDSGDGHEGSVTIVQIQSLRAARNAGIVVPKQAIDKCHDYLKKATTSDGGIMYRLGSGSARPALAAQAVACLFSSGEYTSDHAKKLLKYCQANLPIGRPADGRFGHFEYMQYYYGQVLYMLGNDGWDKLFPGAKDSDKLTWKKYRTAMFDHLVSTQSSDGSWTGTSIGPVYATACFLTVLQLDKAVLPIYQR